jgi:glycosyltransferase involved in cell wall biosynthesis
MSKLTLGVLVYNQATFVEELIHSIKDQSDGNFSIVILDNASTDGSYEKIERSIAYFGLLDRTSLMLNSKNTGSAEGLKQLLESTKTDFLAVAHGDDILKNDYISSVKLALDRFPNVTALNVELDGFNVTGGVSKSSRTYKALWTRFDWLNALLVSGLNPGLMPGSVLNRNEILTKGLLDFPEVVNGVEDALLWMRIIRKGGCIRAIQEPIYQYRLHENQFSHQDPRNSYYFGLARRLNIQEVRGIGDAILAKAEVAYEISRFGKNSKYLQGLSLSRNIYWFYAPIRIINIAIRRLVTFLKLNAYR